MVVVCWLIVVVVGVLMIEVDGVYGWVKIGGIRIWFVYIWVEVFVGKCVKVDVLFVLLFYVICLYEDVFGIGLVCVI